MLAVFADPDELDPTPGRSVLEEAGFEVAVLGTRDPAAIASGARDAAAILIGYAPIDAALLASLGELRIISAMAVGFDCVDLEAAAERGVWVTNVPAAATEEVAVHALSLCLSLVRRVTFLDRHVREGGWALDATETMRRPSTLTLGIVGLGRIGRHLSGIASPVFGRILGHDPYLAEDAFPTQVERSSLEDLLARSDVVSLHVPGSRGASPLLDAGRLALMRPGAALVNVSRGSLVDLAALASSLDSGHLSGAALDVLPAEPPPPHEPILRHPRVVVTPHLAYLSEESAVGYVVRAAENIVAWARTGRPLDPVVTPVAGTS